MSGSGLDLLCRGKTLVEGRQLAVERGVFVERVLGSEVVVKLKCNALWASVIGPDRIGHVSTFRGDFPSPTMAERGGVHNASPLEAPHV